MADVVEVIIKATDQASDTLETVGGKMDRLGGLAKGALAAGLGIAAAGVTALTGVLVTSVGAAADAERVTAQLEAVIRSTGGAAGLTVADVQALGTSLSNLSTFEDDAINSASALMLTFTNVGSEVFPTAMQAVLDMSTAMGQDLSSSTVQLGKALNDPIAGITALSRVGVSFTEDQKTMIEGMVEAGDTMGAQKIILAELAKEFGGSASAQAETFTGKMAQMRNRIGEVQEGIGTALLPVLSTLVDTYGPKLLTAAENAGTFFAAFVSGDAVGARTALEEMFGKDNVAKVEALSAKFNEIATTVGPALITFFDNAQKAVQPLADVVIPALQEAFQQVGEWVTANLPLMQETVETVIGAITEFWTTNHDAIFLVVKTVWENIKSSINIAITAVKAIIETVMHLINGDWESAWNTVKTAAETIWNDIKDVFGRTFSALVTILAPILEDLKGALADAWEDIKAVAETWWESVKTSIGDIVQELKEAISAKLEEIKTALADAWDSVKGTVEEKWDAVKTAMTAKWLLIQEDIGLKLEEIKTVLSFAWDDVKTTLETKWNDIKAAAETKFNEVKAAITTFITEFTGLFSGINLTSIGEAIMEGLRTGIGNRVQSLIDSVTGAVGSIIDAGRAALGIESPSKVFQEIGAATMEGMALGILQAGPQVRAAVESVIESVADVDTGAAAGVVEDLQALQAALDFRNLLADWTDDVKGKVAARIEVLGAVIMMIVTEMNRIAQEGPSLTDAAQALAKALPDAAQAFEAAHDLRESLSEWTQDVKGLVADRIAVLGAVISIVTTEINRVAQGQTLTTDAQALAGGIKAAIEAMKAAGDLREQLIGWGGSMAGTIGARIEVLGAVIGLVAVTFNRLAREWDNIRPTQDAKKLVDGLKAIIEVMGEAASLRQQLVDWAQENIGGGIQPLRDWLQDLADTIHEYASLYSGAVMGDLGTLLNALQNINAMTANLGRPLVGDAFARGGLIGDAPDTGGDNPVRPPGMPGETPPRGFTGARAGVSVVINGPFTIREEADIEKVARALAQKIGQQTALRRRGGFIGSLA